MDMHKSWHWAGRMMVAAACGTAAVWMSACNILGPAIMLVHGPDKEPAQFTLDKQRPTVVFVDDRASVLPRRSMRLQIAGTAQKTLLSERVLTNVIDATAAMNVAAHETSGQPIDLASLAKAVQAEVVIYVSVDSFVLSPDGQTFAPEAHYHAKVIDITRPEPRVWPPEHEGYPFSIVMKPGNAAAPKVATEQLTALNALADRSGVAIAQLFFSHDPHEHIGQ
jgi:hypothetical protein